MMNTNEKLKETVKSKYSLIVEKSNKKNYSSCCGPSDCGCKTVENVFIENYNKLAGYLPEADLKLGCGIPTEHAGIKTGYNVLDLGSGAGNDCFVARAIVGENGNVTGLDFTDEMIKKAQNNNAKLGYSNVKFIQGDIENMPIPDNNFDVVISNCVLNLVPDKEKAFSEIYRVLKPGGHFCISDMVLEGELPNGLKKSAEMYAGCISGAMQKNKYLHVIKNAGFQDIEIKSDIQTIITDEILSEYLTLSEIQEFKNSKTGIYSITVTARKK